MNNLYPGAMAESVVMVWDYCVARQLDPLKKPCHIVPMQVKDAKSGDYIWRDVVMPGIYEYRTTATRTGLYMGHSKPEYGAMVEYLGIPAPEFCEMTMYRWSNQAGQRIEYPVRVYFRECAGTRRDKVTKDFVLNQRWATAPIQMMTKVCEAAGLREAFPDELGGEHTADEVESIQFADAKPSLRDHSGRPDTSNVDFELRDKWIGSIVDTMNQDKEEKDIARDLVSMSIELSRFEELYTAVFDKLAADKIISKAKFKEYLKLAD
jgi:phage recombination protein Bet